MTSPSSKTGRIDILTSKSSAEWVNDDLLQETDPGFDFGKQGVDVQVKGEGALKPDTKIFLRNWISEPSSEEMLRGHLVCGKVQSQFLF